MRNGIFKRKAVGILCLLAILWGFENDIDPLSASQITVHSSISSQSGPNVATFERLGRIGTGIIHNMELSPDGTIAAVATTEGVFLYDAVMLTQLRDPLTDDSIVSVSWSPNGERLALAGVHEPSQVWERGDDQTDWRRLAIMQGQEHIWYWGLLWSPDSSKLASDRFAWNVETGEILTELEERSQFVGWLSDNEQAVFIRDYDQEAVVWDFSVNQVGMVLEGAESVYSPELSPDGEYLAALTDEADRLIVWELATNPMPLVEFDLNLGAKAAEIAWSPDSRYVSVLNETSVVMADMFSEQQYPILNGSSGLSSVVWSQQGDKFIIKGETITQVWSVSDREEQFDLSPTFGRSGETVWSADGEWIVVVSGGRVRIIDSNSGDVVQEIGSQEQGAGRLNWLSGNSAIVGTSGYGVYTWDVSTGDVMAEVEDFGGYINQITWSPNGRYLASTSADDTLSIWDVESGDEIYSYSSFSGLVAWSPVDQDRIAVEIEDNTIEILNPLTGEMVRRLDGGTDFIRDMAWSPDGTWLAGVSFDGSVTIWNIDTPSEVLTFTIPPLDYPEDRKDSATSIAWSPDGTQVITATGYCGLYVWNALTGSQVAQLVRHEDGHFCNEDASWSADGSLIATTTNRRGGLYNLDIWDAESYEMITILDSPASNFAWSPIPSSHTIATGELVMWNASTERVVNQFVFDQLWLFPTGASSIAWSPDGTRFAATEGRYIWIWGNRE